MYGLPADVDLSFLVGKQLWVVSVGMHQVILNFGDYLSVSVMSLIGCETPGSAYVEYEDFQAAAAVLVMFLEHEVKSVKGAVDGTLILEFQDGGRITILDDSPHYESYVITFGDKLIVV